MIDVGYQVGAVLPEIRPIIIGVGPVSIGCRIGTQSQPLGQYLNPNPAIGITAAVIKVWISQSIISRRRGTVTKNVQRRKSCFRRISGQSEQNNKNRNLNYFLHINKLVNIQKKSSLKKYSQT